MSSTEYVRIQRLLIKGLEECEPLSNEDWCTAVVHGKVDSQDKLADEIQRHIDRRMIACAAELKQLREERDEARQRLCKVVGDNRDMWGEDVAKEYGWDCFKEDRA